MRVLRLTPHFYFPKEIFGEWKVNLDQIGGMQTQIYRLVKSLSKKGIKQTILTIGPKKLFKLWDIDDNIRVIKSNIPIIPIKSKIRGTIGLNIYWAVGTIGWIIKYSIKSHLSNLDEFDRIHAHCSGVASPLVVGLFAKLILKKELIYTIHCSRIATYEPMSKMDKLFNNLIIWIEKKCLLKADKIIFLTERTRDIVLSNYNEISYDKTMIIPDYISFEDFKNNVTKLKIDEFIMENNIPRDKKIITFIGRIAHEKGWKYLIESVNSVRRQDVYFLICGDGNERREMETLIEQLNIQNKVKIIGYLSNDYVALAIQISNIIVMPSIHEEFGGLILEVACIQKPIIATNVGGIPISIKDNENGILINPKSPKEIAEKIDYLLNNEELSKQLGENLYTSMKNKYDEDIVIKKYEYCY